MTSSDRSGHHHWPFAAYAASVASLTGRHQSSCAWYHSMVFGQPGLEVLVRRLPAELLAQLAGLDRVAAVVARAVGDVVEVVLRTAEVLEDQLDDLEVVLLAVGADQVGLADLALVEDRPDGAGVVVGVDPVADVEPVAVQLRAAAHDHVGDLARDELLDVLPGPVVVGAVRDRRLHAEAADPGTHQVVRAGLRGGVRAGGVVRRVLGEALRVVEVQVAVDLVGGDVVEAYAGLAHGLEDRERAEDVRLDERARVVERVVVVRLGRVVHDRVVLGHQRLDDVGVGDVADDQLDAVEALHGLARRGVRELVEDRDVGVGVVDQVVHEVGADEPGTTGHEQARHGRAV